MNDYEAKRYYLGSSTALSYNAQYESPIRPWNVRAKLVGWRESAAFLHLLGQTPPGGNVLDVACGTGRYTNLLLRSGYHVGGVDISSEMLEFAKSRLDGHPSLMFLRNGDAENLPFEDQQFDGVTCVRLFHRVPREPRQQMLREVKRVGRSWAILFFGMSTPWLRLRRKVRSKVLQGRSSNPYPMSLGELRSELENLDFVVKDCRWVLPLLSEGMVVHVTWKR